MKALVLERKAELSLRDFPIVENLSDTDVRIGIKTVGICGSDVHYYQHGQIGPFIVEEPMILGHEASGVILETGKNIQHLKVGDRVCMEPGIPTANSRATLEGMYNLDPSVSFWATPPVHGCLRPEVVHPGNFTFKLPESVSFGEGAMVEPLAVGMHAAMKAAIQPGDIALVTGAGPIGVLTALAVLAAGCSEVILTDIIEEKLALARELGPITTVNTSNESLHEVIQKKTNGWGVDRIFEASGHPAVFQNLLNMAKPGGTVVLVGMPPKPIAFDVVTAQIKELRIEHVFRYAHVYPRALALMGSGKIDVRKLITDTFAFEDSIKAFDFASSMPPTSVKAQIVVSA